MGPLNPEPSALADQTDVGSYFVATYPPFSVWTRGGASIATRGPRSRRRGDPAVPLGLYLHIPFCRKRCHFCYFRVYTDKNASGGRAAISTRSRASGSCTREQPAIAGPAARTSSTSAAARRRSCRRSSCRASSGRLTRDRRRGASAEEITFECEPGTLTEAQARGDPPARRHAAEPRRRELRRSHPRAQRPRAPLAGDRAGLSRGARARLSADQHRPHRRHARRDRRELARRASRRRSRSSRTASPSTRWSCPSTRRSARTC